MLPITFVFVSLFALAQVAITLRVGLYRGRSGVRFLDGGDQHLLRIMRAHGNFTETVPIGLMVLGATEGVGAPGWLLWGMGGLFVLARGSHYLTVTLRGSGQGRRLGMVGSFTTYSVGAAYVLYQLGTSPSMW